LFKHPIAASTIAVLVMLAGGPFGAVDAHAVAVYTGTFDPRGPVYGFAGTHQFEVDESCLATTGWKHANGFSGSNSNPALYPSCGNVVLIGGSLTLRKYATIGTDENATRFPGVPDKTFQFSEAQNDWNPNLRGPGLGGMSYYIRSIFVSFNPISGRNELGGIDTPETFGAFGPFDGINWALYWVSGQRPVDAFGGNDGSPAGVYLLQDCVIPFNGQCAGARADVAPASATFERVPEPGSLALVAAALMAAGIGARRARGG